MLGMTNSSQAEGSLNSNDTVCCYRVHFTSGSAGTPLAGYQHGFLSYSAPTFTVKKSFTANLYLFGRGSRNQNASSRPLSYTFKKNGETAQSGSFGYSGSHTDAIEMSFTTGDTFAMSGSINSDAGTADMGFCLKFKG